jgi:hypothetical protein
MKVVTLFSVSLTHEYFSNGGSFVQLVPTAETQRVLKSFGWFVRTGNNNLLAAAETEADGSLRFAPPADTVLRFWLDITDGRFVNYTDLPSSAAKQLLYFSNTGSNTTDATLLHEGAAATEANTIQPHTTRFATPDEGTLALRNRSGSIVAQTASTPPHTVLPIHPTAEGWHQPALNDTLLPPLCLGIQPMGLNAKGMVEISLATDAAQPCITPDNKPAGTAYRIHFAARSVRWKYLVTGAGIDTYTQLAITDIRRTQFFTGPETTTLINGSKALAFTSPESIRFSDKPNGAFQLRRNCVPGGNAGTVVFDRLPRPAPDLLHGSSAQYYTEIIVHL